MAKATRIFVKQSIYDRVQHHFLEGTSTCIFTDAKTGAEIARFDGVDDTTAFHVQYLGKRKDKFKVSKVRPPHQQANLLLWLMDIPLAKSHHTYIEHEDECERARAKFAGQPGYKEFIFAGHGYEFAYFMRAEDQSLLPMSGYVDAAADRELAMAIMSNRDLARQALGYDSAFVKGLMRERFGFTKQDMAKCGLSTPR